MSQCPQLVDTDPCCCQEADEEHDGAQEAEYVHGLTTEGAQEPQCQQVEIAVYEAVQTHELRLPVLPCLVVYHLLTDLVEARILGQIGDEAVHLAIYLDILHHVATISLQSAVEVVQVLDPAHLPCRGVEQLRGDGFRQRVVAFLLVTRNEVVAAVHDHVVQLGNLIGRILQVGIHRDHHITLSSLEAAVEGRTLSVVPAELDAFHVRVLLAQLVDHCPRVICGAVVHEDHLERIAVLFHHTFYPRIQLGNRLVFII